MASHYSLTVVCSLTICSSVLQCNVLQSYLLHVGTAPCGHKAPLIQFLISALYMFARLHHMLPHLSFFPYLIHDLLSLPISTTESGVS